MTVSKRNRACRRHAWIEMVSFLFIALVAVGATTAVTAASVAPAEQAESARVNLNTASAEQLMQLPGVGETVAKRIIEYREKNGPFKNSEELMNVRGIGEKTFLKLKPFLSVGSER